MEGGAKEEEWEAVEDVWRAIDPPAGEVEGERDVKEGAETLKAAKIEGVCAGCLAREESAGSWEGVKAKVSRAGEDVVWEERRDISVEERRGDRYWANE